MLEFGGVLTANNLFNSFGGNADKLLLGKFYPASIVGLYTRAQTLMLQPLSQFMPAVQNVVLPVMSRLAERPEKLKEVFLDTLRVTAFACSFMTVFLVVASDWLVLVFLGPKWIEAGAILRLLAGPAFVIPLNALCVLCLTVQGKSGLLLRWGIINNVLTILAIAAGVLWGAEGVAAALTLIALLVLAPYLTYLASKAGPASWPEIIGALGPGTAACAVGCIVLFSVRKALGLHSAPVGLAVLFALSCVYHALVMSLLPSGRRSLAGMRDVASSFRRMKAAPDTSAA
jgi:PST family polysaccharide transporter